ncbi:MAG: hypothetical protein EOP86_04205 [Verrucomicrobiaceae bacterium]|nr:MAG: hypothetical protein EOP86_04205 [Verrucomicrobiaceae bacterium]
MKPDPRHESKAESADTTGLDSGSDAAFTADWLKLAAARQRILSENTSQDEGAPFGFAARVAALATTSRREPSPLSLWTRWAWRTAVLTVGGAALAAAWPSPGGNAPLLLKAPALEIPAPIRL